MKTSPLRGKPLPDGHTPFAKQYQVRGQLKFQLNTKLFSHEIILIKKVLTFETCAIIMILVFSILVIGFLFSAFSFSSLVYNL